MRTVELAERTARCRFPRDIEITNLRTTDQSQHEEFIKWTGLHLEGIDFNWRPDQVKVAAIRVDGLKTSLLMDAQPATELAGMSPGHQRGSGSDFQPVAPKNQWPPGCRPRRCQSVSVCSRSPTFRSCLVTRRSNPIAGLKSNS